MRDICQGITPVKKLKEKHTLKEQKNEMKIQPQVYKDCAGNKSINVKLDTNKTLQPKENNIEDGKLMNIKINSTEVNYKTNIYRNTENHKIKDTMMSDKPKTNMKDPKDLKHDSGQSKNEQIHQQMVSIQTCFKLWREKSYKPTR